MIHAANLECCRKKNGKSFKVFSGLTFHLPKGRGLMLCGVNGAGKSTLLSILAGLLPPGGCGTPGAGTLKIGGVDACEDNAALRSKSSLMLQNADMQILGGTVADDLLTGMTGGVESCDEARQMAGRLGLGAEWDTPVQQLSYGQKRKLCLATALLPDPELLLLDEPLSGLDWPAATEFMDMLGKLRADGLSLVLSSHDLGDLARLTDYVLLLRPDGPASFGTLDEVLPELEAAGVRRPYRL